MSGVDQMAMCPRFDPAMFPLVLSAPYPTELGCYFYLASSNMITHHIYKLQDFDGGYRLTGGVGFRWDPSIRPGRFTAPDNLTTKDINWSW